MKNLTPHPIHVYSEGEVIRTYPSVGSLRLVPKKQTMMESVDGVPVISPPEHEDISGDISKDSTEPILVSMLVGNFLAENKDRYKGPVYGPDTSPDGVVRNEEGNISGCKRFVFYKGMTE